MYIFIIGWSRTQLSTRYNPKPTMAEKKNCFITSFRIADVLCKGAIGERTNRKKKRTIAEYVLRWRLVHPKSFITRYLHTR